MAKGSRKDGTSRGDRFGPFRPMRGARGMAEAAWLRSPRPVSPTEARLNPGANNLLRKGADYEISRRAGRWRA